MTTLAAGASTSLTLPAGQTFTVPSQTAVGVALFGPGPRFNQPIDLGTSSVTLGAYPVDQILYLTCKSGTLSYSLSSDTVGAPAPAAGVTAFSQLTGGLTDNVTGARQFAMGGLSSSPLIRHMAADLATVATVTPPAPSTPANELITTTSSYSLGSAGSCDWGGHQNRVTRMGDYSLFFIDFDSSYNLRLWRSATGGTYGSAWTLIDTINMTGRETKDKDAHLLRNPKTDQVHLICSDNSGPVSTYRIRTYANSSTKTLVNDVMVPCRWPGSGASTSVGWFALTQSPNYSACSIGADGTICFVASLSTGTLDGGATSEMNAIKRWQFWKLDGSTWTFTPIYSQRLNQLTNMGTPLGNGRDAGGPRLNYDRIWISPQGHEGYVVGICGMDVKFKDWSAVRNPNYSASWTNTNADATYFGSGRYPELWMWKVPLSNLSQMSLYALAMPQYRTTDLPSSPPSAAYGGFIIQDVFMDSSGRIWIGVNEGDTNTTQQRNVIVCDTNGTQLAKFLGSSYGITSGTCGGFFEDLSGSVWMQVVMSGNAMSTKLLTTTITNGVPTAIQTYTAATEQKTTQWATNLTTGLYQCIPTAAAFQFQPNKRNGSVLSNNWFDMIVGCGPDHTGTAPGTAQTLPTNGTYQFKRVRVQIPAA